MKIILYLSDLIMPLVIFYIVGFGLLMKKNVYDDFVKGAEKGFKTVIGIMPTLIGLMVAVAILRASGFLDFLAGTIGAVTERFIPSELIPLIFIRMFSSSAATGMVLDIFKEHGPDSEIGLITSILMGCTETIFYTMSIYFMTAGVKKTRYTLAGALLATFTGVVASVFLAGLMK